MIIGIDASRAYVSERTGTENYSYHLIKEILRLPESKKHTFVLFIRPNSILPQYLDGYSNLIVKVVKMKYLWTQLGLAWETWQKPILDRLWIPAHTLPVLRNPKTKTVVTIHGVEYKWLPEYKNWLQKWYLPLSTYYAAKSADTLIAVSQFTKNELEKELHNSTMNIKVIHEGVTIEVNRVKNTDKSVLDKYGVLPDKYVLFVGTVQPRKNLVQLIDGFSEFSRVNPGYKLVIAGGIGWMAEEILRAPNQYEVAELVVFTGRVSETELSALYQSASVYVQPSITEGFGLPILEAMANNVPVITSNGGALSEICGSAGIVIPIGDQFVSRLSKTIENVVKDQTMIKKMIVEGKKRVESLNWKNAARETLKVLLS